MRKSLVFGLLALIFASIVWIFWQEELRYSLPTPIPEDYEAVAIGSCLDLPIFKEENLSKKGTLLHFFNPECPCSRFNATHFKYLVREFSDEIDFRVIIPEGASFRKTRRILGNSLAIYEDTNELWSKTTGVYASPQAVIISKEGSLYYRGNYNKARFCTFPGSNYAEISLNLLLRGSEAPIWDFYATTSYGCQLPEQPSLYSSLFFWNDSKEKQQTAWNMKDLP